MGAIEMSKFEVTITRTESITFVLDAINQRDAELRALMDGEEIAAKTVHTEIENVEEITE